jgi:hypothetical protein
MGTGGQLYRVRQGVLVAALGLTQLGVAIAAPDGAKEAAKPVALDDIKALFQKRGEISTSAQLLALHRKATEMVVDKPFEAAVTVTDVVPGTLKEKPIYSIQATNVTPPFGLSFYASDRDRSMGLNVGDEVKLRGVGYAVVFEKGNRLVVNDAKIVAHTPLNPAAVADMSLFVSGGNKDEPAALERIQALYAQRAKFTTTAQRVDAQTLATKGLEGRKLKATVKARDVVAVVFREKEAFSVEADGSELGFKLRFIVADSDKALSINKGDEVTLEGAVFGLNFGGAPKDNVVVVERTQVLSHTPKAKTP